jgi:hypothetical protein
MTMLSDFCNKHGITYVGPKHDVFNRYDSFEGFSIWELIVCLICEVEDLNAEIQRLKDDCK